MAVTFHDGRGKSPKAFFGYKVNVFNGRRKRTKKFSCVAPSGVPSELWAEYQRLNAEYFEAICAKNAAAISYLKSVRSNFSTCKPKRGLGVHGLTMSIAEINNRFYCYFNISQPDGGPARKVVISKNKSFTAALTEAVDIWAEENEVREKDKLRVLDRAPGPEAFRELRRQMNVEGFDIPPEALHEVFSEKRASISREKVLHSVTKTTEKAVSPNDIESWFTQQVQAR